MRDKTKDCALSWTFNTNHDTFAGLHVVYQTRNTVFDHGFKNREES